MAYKPSAEDFDIQSSDQGYTPSAEDFEELPSEIPAIGSDFKSHNELDQIRKDHPYLYKLAEKLSQNPSLDKLVKDASNSPIVEAGLSAQPALINAFKNIGNLAPLKVNQGKLTEFPTVSSRNLTDEPMWNQTERAFEEPDTLSGKIGSGIGNLIGAGTAFAAVPGSSSIPGALATGFAEGEGGIVNRTANSLMGLLIPGLLHGKKFINAKQAATRQSNKIKNLELEKLSTTANVHEAKSALANKLNKELEPAIAEKEKLKSALEAKAGSSESESKIKVAEAAKVAKKANAMKYSNLYEGFNNSKAGQSKIKDPIHIGDLEKDYGLNVSNLSSDTKNLIKSHVGEVKDIPQSEEISVITGKPISAAGKEIIKAKPKVADYINLWKQLRSEVSQYKHSARMAETPEAAHNFRTKARDLEKLSDSIHSKAMGSLSKADADKYSQIQKGYMNEVVPFSEESLLSNATEKNPKIPENFFKKLNQLGTPELIKSLKSSHPEFVEAITKHDIRGLSKLGADELKELVSGDFGKFITPEAKNILTSLHGAKSKQELFQKALGKVQTSEIGREVKSSDINAILRNKPELAKSFSGIKSEQAKLRELKNALVQEGFRLKEINEKLAKYKSVGSAAKALGIPIGTYIGLKKKNKNSSDDN